MLSDTDAALVATPFTLCLEKEKNSRCTIG